MDFEDFRFTKTHEWVKLAGDGLAYIGITDHAQEEITDVVFVDLPDEGRAVGPGDELLLVDSVKASFSIYAPIGGTVAKRNEELGEDPGLVNSSPYDKGWMVALEPSGQGLAESLMTASEYDAFVASGE